MKSSQNKKKMKSLFEDFKKFINRGSVLDMAVGVTVASAFTAIVTAFSKGFISPLIALLSNRADLSGMKLILREEVSHMENGEVVIDSAEVALLWGTFLQAVLDFLIIALALFAVLRIATSFSKRAKQLIDEVDKTINKEELEEANAKAEAEKKKLEAQEAKIENEKREAEAQKERQLALEKERREEEMALLREIRDLLKK